MPDDFDDLTSTEGVEPEQAAQQEVAEGQEQTEAQSTETEQSEVKQPEREPEKEQPVYVSEDGKTKVFAHQIPGLLKSKARYQSQAARAANLLQEYTGIKGQKQPQQEQPKPAQQQQPDEDYDFYTDFASGPGTPEFERAVTKAGLKSNLTPEQIRQIIAEELNRGQKKGEAQNVQAERQKMANQLNDMQDEFLGQMEASKTPVPEYVDAIAQREVSTLVQQRPDMDTNAIFNAYKHFVQKNMKESGLMTPKVDVNDKGTPEQKGKALEQAQVEGAAGDASGKTEEEVVQDIMGLLSEREADFEL